MWSKVMVLTSSIFFLFSGAEPGSFSNPFGPESWFKLLWFLGPEVLLFKFILILVILVIHPNVGNWFWDTFDINKICSIHYSSSHKKLVNWWVVFMLWLTDERRLTLIPAGTIVRDPHHHESPTHREQDLNLRKTWLQPLLNEVVQ